MTNIRIIAQDCTIISSGRVCTDTMRLTVEDGIHRICIIPSYDMCGASGEVSIGITEGYISMLSDVARAVVYPDHIDIYVCPPHNCPKYSARTLHQLNIPSALVTLYDDGEYHLMLEGNSFFVIDVPRLVDFRLTHHTLSCGESVTLRGTQVDTDEYLLTLIYTDKWRVLHELSASSIHVTSRGVETIDIIQDMRLHEIRTIYHGESMTRHYRATSPHVYIESMAGYLFLEALMLGYDDEARGYLSTQIVGMYEDIISLIGRYDTIESYGDKIAVYYSSDHISVPQLLDIDISNHKITNITKI